MAAKLTDVRVQSLKPKTKRYEVWDSAAPGFGVRVTPKGVKSFVYLYRFDGLPRRMTLGRYPKLSLAKARMQYAAAKATLEEEGTDPGQSLVSKRAASRLAPTVSQLVDEYIEKWAMPRKRSWKEDKRLLEHDVVPSLGRKKAATVTRRDIRLLLDGIIDRGAPITANRVLAVVRKMFRFAVSRDIVPSNPCEAIEAPAKESSRERVLSESELKTVWNGLQSKELSMSEPVKMALRLMLVTGQRKGEVVSARWNEIDLKAGWWTIPPEKAKNGLPHRVPLSPLALTLLKEIRELSGDSQFLLPSSQGDKSIRDDAVSKAVRRNEAQLKVAHFTPHDLRRTAASHMASSGISRLVISKILNHVDRGVTAVYDRHSYDREKRTALNAWSRHLDTITSGKKTSKVVNIK
jgi:integrase